MVRLQSPPSLLRRIVIGESAVLIPRIDGQVIAGTTLEFAGFQKQVTAGAISNILRGAVELCPGLADSPIEELWSGLRPHTEDGLPIIGPGPLAGLFLATGHYRDGILLAPITAKLIAELVLGRTPSVELRPFRIERLLR
jgi:glycine oxidase